ncbi:MAG: lytic transglycosylase domain-containing protein [Ilumatobacteraceae bacterium]
MILRPKSLLSVLAALAVAACAADGAQPERSGPVSTDVVVQPTAPPASPPLTTTSATTPPTLFPDAAALAAELSAIEAAIRSPDVEPAELAAWGRRQQLAYRAVNRHPEWHAELIEMVDAVASGPLSYHLAARQAQIDHAAQQQPTTTPSAASSTVPVPPTLPAWTIVEPLPVAELRGYYAEAEAATGVPWQYLAAINFQETRMGRVVGVSSAGAVGPMQFLPSTWAQCCEGDPTVTRDAILGAAHFLALSGAPADMQAALSAYNPNSAYVGAVTAYAQNMVADERAYLGYHGWEVFYNTGDGTVRLPTGYSESAPIDAIAYLRDHPQDLVPAG